MICHVCGKEVPDGSAFCNSCGAQMPQDGAVVSQEPTETIQQSAMNPLEEQVLPEETQQADQPSLEPLAAQISSEDNKKKVKKYSKAIGIVSAALGIAIIVLIFLLLRSCKSGKNPATQVWSDWSDSLPANISADKYVIEEQTLYSSRTLETTASTEESALDGWELYDTIEGGEDYGPWSEWSDTEVAASDTRAVETQNLYRYRDKETTTDSSSTKDGWELEDTTYDYGNYGSWSNWSTTAVSKSESRQVETTTQYRYRDKKYKTSTSSSLSGWTKYDSSTTYGSWGSWSSWSSTKVSGSDTREVETRVVEPTYRTEYNYSRYTEKNAALGGGYGWAGPSKGYWSDIYCQYYQEKGWSTTRLTSTGSNKYGGDGTGTWYNEQVRQVQVTAGYTQYRYRDRSKTTTYSYYQWGSWSSWGNTAYSNSSNREVQTRTVYRYRDRSKVATYHFWRWGSWSDWSESNISETSDRQVESKICYRYRDLVKNTTYYFRKWSDWSDYSETPASASETTEVRTKTRCRYKLKSS